MGSLMLLPVVALCCLLLSATLDTATAAKDLLEAPSMSWSDKRRELLAAPVPNEFRDAGGNLGAIINFFTEPDLNSGSLGFNKVSFIM